MIVEHSGDNSDFDVCIAVSGRQTEHFNYEVSPGKYFSEESHRPSGAYAQALGQGSTRLQRGHLVYQTMGHTAIFVRQFGARQRPVVGFFPKESWMGSLTPSGWTAHGGGAVEGAWHLDNWMFDDRAALSYEIPINKLSSQAVLGYLQQRIQSPDTAFQYQTRQDPGDDERAARNCVAAAMLLLENISRFCLLNRGRDVGAKVEIARVISQVKRLLAERGFLQGQMQQLVQTGFTHLPTAQ